MFDVDRILAIPDQSIDYLQCGIAGKERAALEARGFVRKDGTKAKDYIIRTIQKTGKNKEKAIIKGDKKLSVKLSKPAKSLNQKSDQAYRLHEQTKAKVERLKGKLSDLYDEGSKLQDRLDEAKSKVESGRTKKASSTQKDIGKFAASLQSELANGGQPVPVMRQKGNKKQIAELDDKINENFNQRIALQSQVKRLQSRAGKLLDASQDYADKASRATTKSNRGLEVTYNKKGDLSSAATATKAKKAISGQAKGGKVVKGVKPSDRTAKLKSTNSLRVLSEAESAQNRKDSQKNRGKLAALADSAIAEFSRKGAKSHNDSFPSTLEVNGEKLPALFSLQKDKNTTNGSVIVLKGEDAYRITFKTDANTNKRKSQRITQVKDQGLIQSVRQQIKDGKENILQYAPQKKYKWINGVKVEA